MLKDTATLLATVLPDSRFVLRDSSRFQENLSEVESQWNDCCGSSDLITFLRTAKQGFHKKCTTFQK